MQQTLFGLERGINLLPYDGEALYYPAFPSDHERSNPTLLGAPDFKNHQKGRTPAEYYFPDIATEMKCIKSGRNLKLWAYL